MQVKLSLNTFRLPKTNSELIKHIIVTTESDEVRELTKKYKNVIVFDRDESYMGEREV